MRESPYCRPGLSTLLCFLQQPQRNSFVRWIAAPNGLLRVVNYLPVGRAAGSGLWGGELQLRAGRNRLLSLEISNYLKRVDPDSHFWQFLFFCAKASCYHLSLCWAGLLSSSPGALPQAAGIWLFPNKAQSCKYHVLIYHAVGWFYFWWFSFSKLLCSVVQFFFLSLRILHL